MQITIRTDVGKYVINSTVENEGTIYEARANDLANIIAYDKEHYNDVNLATLLRAAQIAGLTEVKQS